MSAVQKIQKAIEKADHILVVTHIGPDGDAFGSLTAVGVILEHLGKSFSLVCDDAISQRFKFLPLSDQIQTAPNAGTPYDLLIAVDCGDESRMGHAFSRLPEPRPFSINIDHHITNTRFGSINLIGTSAVSTTEVLYDIFGAMSIPMTKNLAVSLLCGLVTDTLSFRTDGVSAKTLRIAGSLVEAGADISQVTNEALNLKPLSTLHLWQAGLGNMKNEDGLIWTTISNKERKLSGHAGSGSGGLVNFLADIRQAAIGAVLMEMENGDVRVGFRCRPPYSVSEIALNLGGGGHALASGCTLPGPLIKAEALVVALSKETIRQQEATFSNGGHGA